MAMSLDPNQQTDISLYSNQPNSEEIPETRQDRFEDRFEFKDSSELPPPDFSDLPPPISTRSTPLTRRTLPRASTGVFGARPKTTFSSQNRKWSQGDNETSFDSSTTTTADGTTHGMVNGNISVTSSDKLLLHDTLKALSVKDVTKKEG